MAASTTPELALLEKLQFDLGDGVTRIVHPDRADYAEIARQTATGLAAITGTPLPIFCETDPTLLAGPGALIVLGNLMESILVRRLYLEAYDFTDLAFPSEGGYALRTIRDPFDTGAHVILAGGSEIGGVKLATAALVAEVRQQGAKLGYLNKVKLGNMVTADEIHPVYFLADTDEIWSRVGASGSWEYMERIALAGVGYLRSADERYLGLFQRELHHFIEYDVYHPHPEAKQMLHGRMHLLLLVWDLVQDHPRFDVEERRTVDTMFLYVGRSEEGVAYIRERCREKFVRFNHATRAGLDAFFIGRYFKRRYRHVEASEWLRDASELFTLQFTSCKPMEDSWGHQWLASMHNTLIYAMATGSDYYWTSAAFKRTAERALLAHGTVGPRVYLAACALVTRDARYLSFERDGAAMVRAAARHQLGTSVDTKKPPYFEEVLRSFAWTTKMERREDLLGLQVAPLDELWTKSIESPEFSPPGIFATTLSHQQSFDKLAIREGWDDGDFFLLLDGISGGVHAYQDANCLVWMREGGVEWFKPRMGFMHAMGVRAHNGVNTALNGQSAQQIHRYARLLYQDTVGEFYVVGTALSCVGETIWERHILRRRGQWTLVLDRVVSRAPGELLAERFWYPQGESEMHQDGFTCRQTLGDGEIILHLAISESEHRRADESLVERQRVRVKAGDEITLAGLLWTDRNESSSTLRIAQTPQGVSVSNEEGIETVVNLLAADEVGCGMRITDRGEPLTLGKAGTLIAPPEVEKFPTVLPVSNWEGGLRENAPSGKAIMAVAGTDTCSVVGTIDGLVVVYDLAMQERWRAQLPSMILSLEISGEDLVVGEDRGALTLFDCDGGQLWSKEIPWVTIPWAYWSEGRSRIREIATADINGDGVEEILVSNADRRVYAFDRAGRELWKCPIEWGVYTAMCPGVFDGEFALLGGPARPSIFGFVKLIGADGAVRRHFERVDIVSWSMPSGIRDLQQADIDGDGNLETIHAVDANMGQLIAYTAEGEVKWDCDIAASAGALTFDGKAQRVYVSSDAGYLVAVESATGHRRWNSWIGEQVELLWVLADGCVVALAQRGSAWLISPAGDIQGRIDLGEPITAIPRPGNHRGPGRKLIIGTQSGRVLTLP